MKRTCVVCNDTFWSKLPNKQTCSPDCATSLLNQRTRNWRRVRKGQPPEPITQESPMNRTCTTCGAPVEPPRRLTCSDECSNRRHNQRKTDMRRATTYHPIEVELMRKAGTAIVAEGMCPGCNHPLYKPSPGDSTICTWCWTNRYMPAEDRQRLKESSRF